MNNLEPAALASLIGGLGSLAYFTAMFFGFLGGEEILARLWPPNRSVSVLSKVLRIIWYMSIGAGVAFVFQLPEQNLAPIQAFIIGATWPTVVAQILTGRQGESPKAIKSQIAALLGDTPREV